MNHTNRAPGTFGVPTNQYAANNRCAMRNDTFVLAALRPLYWARSGSASRTVISSSQSTCVIRFSASCPSGPQTARRYARLGPRSAAKVLLEEHFQVPPEREQGENRREQQPDVGLRHPVVAIPPQRLEYPVVLRGVVQPELAPVPRGGHHLPPATRAREEQGPKVRAAADQAGELVGIDEMVHQAGDPQGRVAEMTIPELDVPFDGRASLGRSWEPTRARECLRDIAALELRQARNRAEDRTRESHEGACRIFVVEYVLEPPTWIGA